MSDAALGTGLVVLIAALAVALGLGLGIVVAPRIGRVLDRMDRDDEEPDDRAD